MMPPLKLLRNVIDRMKNIHDYFIITANMAGELTLKVETDMVSVATFYTNLDHPQIGTRSPPFAKDGLANLISFVRHMQRAAAHHDEMLTRQRR